MDLLQKRNVQIINKAEDWKDAVRQSVTPLEKGGYVKPEYKEAIISGIEKLGPYIVVAPNVALPHARPEQGVIKSQIAVTLFKENVVFGKREAEAKLFVALAAEDSNSHLNALMRISDILQDEEKVERILQEEDPDKLYGFFE